jgi:hypothetical protein
VLDDQKEGFLYNKPAFYLKHLFQADTDFTLRRFLETVTDPEKGLFSKCSRTKTLHPNPLSFCVPDHLKLFELIGLLTAKVIYLFNDNLGSKRKKKLVYRVSWIAFAWSLTSPGHS